MNKQDITAKAQAILRANDRGGYTVPTAGLYPYQWNWDSVFVALGFSTFDESRACDELETLFEAQWDDGLVPHIIFRRDDPEYFPGPSVWQAGGPLPSSGITQPPVAATVMRDLWTRSQDPAIRERIAAMVPALIRWHQWLHHFRVAEGAVLVTHPWESGRDNSPDWDAAAKVIDTEGVGEYTRRDLQHADASMRPTKEDYDRYIALVQYGVSTGWDHEKICRQGPFRVADPGMTFVLLRACRDLEFLAAQTGHTDCLGELQQHTQTLEDGVQYLWDEDIGAFCSRDLITGNSTGNVASVSFLYAYADAGTEAQRAKMGAHWTRISTLAQFTVPSHDPEDARFDAVRYWRGPIWLVVNYMIARGFAEQGLEDRA
ncbi:MAG: hypothetical protein AAGA84_10690, partial [Pseudomonadota bacterium]